MYNVRIDSEPETQPVALNTDVSRPAIDTLLESETLSEAGAPEAPAPSINGALFAQLFAEIPTTQTKVPDDAIAEFVKAVYDGVPFTRTYELVPGVRISFRELNEHDKQICRQEESLPYETCEFLAALALYENEHKGVKHELISLREMAYDDKHRTPLPQLLRWVSENMLHASGLFDMARGRYDEFKRLLADLYAEAPRFFVQNRPDTR